jgi:hypothetical protein
MRNYVYFGCLALVMCLSFSSGYSRKGSTSSPEGVLSMFDAAIEKNDEAMAKQACTTGFWDDERDAGKHLFAQSVRKKFKLKKKEVKIQKDRAVVTADIIRDGKKVDLLYFYTTRSSGRWFFDGADENRNHGKYYLKEILPARFYLGDYPSNLELKAFGEKMIQLAPQLKEAKEDEDKLKSLLEGVLRIKYSPASALRLLLEVTNLELKLVSNHWIESLKRGAIEIRDKSGKEKVFIYVVRESGEWRMLACHTGWLASDTVLRD